ncbi:MAG: long-chain fatty acid--CoA ligase [Desulfatibacillaceae bacterium]
MNLVKGFPSTSQDDYPLNVTNIVKHANRNFGRQEIVSRKHSGAFHRYTYNDAYNRMKQLGNALRKLDVQVGDRVGVLAWNTHENYEIYFGVPGTGAVMLLLNLRLTPQDLAWIINHAEAKYIIVDETLLPLAQGVAANCPTVKGYVVITDKDLSDVQTDLSPVYKYDDLLAAEKPDFEWPLMEETSAYAACYTTGTTGRPKGVYYSHRDVYLHTVTIAANAEISIQDSFLQLVPMFHALGWGLPQAATMVGAKIVFPGMYALDRLGELADIMVQEDVNVSAGAPALFLPMLEHVKKMDKMPDLSGARFLSGATEPPVSMMKGYWDLTGADIIHAYGATETTPLVTVNKLKPWLGKELSEDDKWDLRRKQGYTVVGLDIRIIGMDGQALPHDGQSSGEIQIRGPWITGSYYNAPGSEEQFTEDGYWKSGDAGTIDPEGYLKITDRVKDLIKSGGEWISSVDMENEILSHPAVLEAAVAGVTHPKWQERPLALVVLRDEYKDKATADDIRDHLARKFAKWQLPDEVLFVDAIPKTSVGKIDKKVIRAEYKDQYHLNP